MTKNSHIFIEDGKIYLSSGLDLAAFARTNFSHAMNVDCGVIISLKEDSDAVFKKWNFIGTEERDGIVYFYGPVPEGAKILSNILDERKESSISEIILAEKAITKAIESGREISGTGSGGIVICESKQEAIILPAEIFERAVKNYGKKEYREVLAFCIHKGLSGKSALLFVRGILAYRALSGACPFSQAEEEKRQIDMNDGNFIPLELAVNGVNAGLAESINASLSIQPEWKPRSGERRLRNPKKEAYKQALLKKAWAFDIEAFSRELEISMTGQDRLTSPSYLSEKEFVRRLQNFISWQKKEITAKRFLRRNGSRLALGLAVLIILGGIILSFYRGNLRLATSRGLTSRETVETLFTGIARADVPLIQEIAKGGDMKALLQITSAYYVNLTQRQNLNQADGWIRPAGWLFFEGKSDFWLYGITNLRIDGKNASSDFSYPVNGDKKKPLTEEDGVKLTRGMEKVRKVDYYLVRTEGNAHIAITKGIEDVTLRWNGKRWLAVKIEGKSENSFVRAKVFKEDYIRALEENSGDIGKATESLREKYPWLPRPDELRAGAEYMVGKYNNSAAKNYLR